MTRRRKLTWVSGATVAAILGTAAAIFLGHLFSFTLPAVNAFLETADTFEVLSLDPGVGKAPDYEAPGNFHGYKVLGKATVRDPKARQELVSVLEKAFYKAPPDTCIFVPTHGVAVAGGKKRLDLVICFGCEDIEMFSDVNLDPQPPPQRGDDMSVLHVHRSMLGPVLNRILHESGVHVLD